MSAVSALGLAARELLAGTAPAAALTSDDLAFAAALAKENVREVDSGALSTYANLQELGERGLLAAGGRREAAELARALAREDMATAFSFWGHRMGLEYHRAAGADLPEDVATGRVPLSSGMAPAFKAASGLGEIPLETVADGDGWTLTGTLPWASNLDADGWIVLPVRGDLTGIIRLSLDRAGVLIRPLQGLLALDGTASGSLKLEDVRVTEEDVLTRSIPDFLAAIRRTFLTVQTAFCLGLAEASLEHIEQQSTESAGPQDVFRSDLTALRQQVSDLRDDWELLASYASLEGSASDGGATSAAQHDAVIRLPLQARLDGARLAADAVALEAKIVGGRGYAHSSPTARRLREAAFLPVQSPTEGHLRWELQRLDAAAEKKADAAENPAAEEARS